MTETINKEERISKRLSRVGICSRREAERWIAKGRVTVDGVQISTPATLVSKGSLIIVDGKKIPKPEPTRLWRYHKPAGILSTNQDPTERTLQNKELPHTEEWVQTCQSWRCNFLPNTFHQSLRVNGNQIY